MAMTMSSAVCPATRTRLFSQSAFAASVFIGAYLTFIFLAAALGGLAGSTAGVACIATVGSWAIMRDMSDAVPVPYVHRQVPEWFRSLLPVPATTAVFGFLLGVGFVTKFTRGIHFVLMIGLAIYATYLTALFALAVYAGTRTLNTFLRATDAGVLTAGLHEMRHKTWILRPASIALSASITISLISRFN